MIRAVVDTSVLVRALLKPQGTVGPVMTRLRRGDYTLLYSEALLMELVDVVLATVLIHPGGWSKWPGQAQTRPCQPRLNLSLAQAVY